MKEQKIFLFALLCLALVFSLNGQETTREARTLIGNITDVEGAPIPGVTVTVTSQALIGAQSAITNEAGSFRIPLLPVGTYTLTAKRSGFQTLRMENIPAGTISLNFQLERRKIGWFWRSPSIIFFIIGIILVVLGAMRGLTLREIIKDRILKQAKKTFHGRLTGVGGVLPGFQMKKKTLIFNWIIFMVGILFIIVSVVFVIIRTIL